MKPSSERNAELIADHAGGMSIADIRAKYSISRARVYQIINPAGYAGQLKRKSEK